MSDPDSFLVFSFFPRLSTTDHRQSYVQELVKLNDTFCRNILPPSATSPSLTLFDPNDTLALALSPTVSPPSESPSDSFEYLPIAAKYASPNLSSSPLSATPGVARLNAYDSLIKGRPSNRTAFRQPSSNTLKGGRTHQSMPPPARSVSAQAGIGGHGNNSGSRLSYHPEHRAPGKLMKSPDGSRVSSSGSTSSTFIPGKNPLPKDLEEVLIVLAGGILEGHVKLAAALRRRYESQYPLVRSLADVFTAHVSVVLLWVRKLTLFSVVYFTRIRNLCPPPRKGLRAGGLCPFYIHDLVVTSILS